MPEDVTHGLVVCFAAAQEPVFGRHWSSSLPAAPPVPNGWDLRALLARQGSLRQRRGGRALLRRVRHLNGRVLPHALCSASHALLDTFRKTPSGMPYIHTPKRLETAVMYTRAPELLST